MPVVTSEDWRFSKPPGVRADLRVSGAGRNLEAADARLQIGWRSPGPPRVATCSDHDCGGSGGRLGGLDAMVTVVR